MLSEQPYLQIPKPSDYWLEKKLPQEEEEEEPERVIIIDIFAGENIDESI